MLLPVLCILLAVAPSGGALDRDPPAHEVIPHPDGPLYVSDLVSFEVLIPEEAVDGQTVQVRFDDRLLGEAGFGPYGVGGRMQASLWWVWDTSGLAPGSYTLRFSLSGGTAWEQDFSLRPVSTVPPPEPEAHWDYTTTDCCTIHYITGTDAERDLEILMAMVDAQAVSVETRMQAPLEESIMVVFLPRTLGHGGFATDGIYISYLDQHYAGGTVESVIHHEMVHVVDYRLGGAYRPAMLVEGLAVYVTGGHYKPESLGPRAGAMLELGWYIPLDLLAEDFYHQQHEIGYLEAGALVGYLVETYGWDAYNVFYRTIPPPDGESIAVTLDRALQAHFDLTLAGLEADFRLYLDREPVTPADRDDLRLTVALYDTLRRYQSRLDPSAYFLTAWLPDGRTMRDRGIVADYLRRPTGWRNYLLESLLREAHAALLDGDHARVEQVLGWVNRLLSLLT